MADLATRIDVLRRGGMGRAEIAAILGLTEAQVASARADPDIDIPAPLGGSPTNIYTVGVDEGFTYGEYWIGGTAPQLPTNRVRVFQTGREIRAVGYAIMMDTSDILGYLQEGVIIGLPEAWTDGLVGAANEGHFTVFYWNLYRPTGAVTVSGGLWLGAVGSVASYGSSGIWYGFSDDAEVAPVQAARQAGDEFWVTFLYSYPALLPADPSA